MTRILQISKDEIVALIEKQYKIKEVKFISAGEESIDFDNVEGEIASKGKEKKAKKSKEVKQNEED